MFADAVSSNEVIVDEGAPSVRCVVCLEEERQEHRGKCSGEPGKRSCDEGAETAGLTCEPRKARHGEEPPGARARQSRIPETVTCTEPASLGGQKVDGRRSPLPFCKSRRFVNSAG